MRTLTPQELDRLVRSNRNLKISALVTLAVLIPVLVVTGMAGISPGLGGGLGVFIGLLLLLPQRRLLSELGLSSAEAKEILLGEREKRSGIAALPPETRAARETVRARIFVGLGLVFLVLLLVSAVHFAGEAGETHEEGTPTDPWFVASFFGAAAGFVMGPAFLYAANAHRNKARQWRARISG